MTNKEFRQLSRRNLLEMLIQQEQQNEMLQARVAELEEQLNARLIVIEKSGTLAEAALALSGIFEAADRAVTIYKENLKTGDGSMSSSPAEKRSD